MIQERESSALPGYGPLLVGLLVLIGAPALAAMLQNGRVTAITVVLLLADIFFLRGLFIVNPNEGKVLQLFGHYVGTVRTPGLKWANPLYFRKSISLRMRNFESAKLKVNDHDGNPIEIGCIVVWRVRDTAEAAFEVDDYVQYVHVQSEAALRNLATQHPYDAHQDTQLSLRANTVEIARQLQAEIQDRLAKAGVDVVEARISHLAYASEIAATMLRRQQASAIVAARTKIVEGAVGMVEMALEQLSNRHIIEMNDDRKAAMVSNLLVVLCGEHDPQPVVNTGSIYQ
jgi:regulator of protease activity HflC (stomatin/prohibitin superfamily)